MLIDNRKKDVLIRGKGAKDGLNNTTLTAEKKYSTNFTKQQKKVLFQLALQWKQQLY